MAFQRKKASTRYNQTRTVKFYRAIRALLSKRTRSHLRNVELLDCSPSRPYSLLLASLSDGVPDSFRLVSGFFAWP